LLSRFRQKLAPEKFERNVLGGWVRQRERIGAVGAARLALLMVLTCSPLESVFTRPKL
jgi:hypothetical protein